MRQFQSYVTSVKWERIHMFVEIRLEDHFSPSNDLEFFLVNNKYTVEAPFTVVEKKESSFLLTLNITNSGVNRCICNGTYTILTVDGEDAISEAGFFGTSSELESWGRCLRYRNNKGAYTVTFLLDEYAEKPRLQLLFYNTNKAAMQHLIGASRNSEPPKKRAPFFVRIAKEWKKRLKSRLKKYKNKFRDKAYKYLNRISHKNPDKEKNILFLSEQSDTLALNMQALLDRMVERGLDKQFHIRFSLRQATSQKQSKLSFVRMLKAIAEADVILIDDHVPLFDNLVLCDNTKVIQIWHAGAGFKGVGYSRWGHAGCPGPFSCHRQYDYCISGSANISYFFSEQFGILDEQVIPTGMPRMDKYLNQENRANVTQELYEKYPAAKNSKVILFAPTYRGRNRAKAYYPYDLIDFESLYRFCSDRGYIVLFKMHPWVSAEVPIEEKYRDRFFDLNGYPNINDLFYITDLLITDYSSSIYEFCLMDKPMLFFAFDKVQYSVSRGFHRDYDTNVPGKICEDFASVMEALQNEDYEFEKVAQYREKHFDFVDDHATDRVIDWLILDQMPERFTAALQKKREYISSVRGRSFQEYFV